MNDAISHFISSSSLERFRIILYGEGRNQIRAYLGEQRFEEYCLLAEKVVTAFDHDHLSVHAPTNLIFIPGVMGSSLQSKTYGGTWWLDLRPSALRRINDLGLTPDGQRDLSEDFQLKSGTTDISYEPFMGAILARQDFGHKIFPYDWRKSLLLSAAFLRDEILSTYESNGHRKVHLVAHSMGGLLVRSTLMEYGEELWGKIGKIVFLGTPHYGSPAIASYLKNHFWGFDLMTLLGMYLSRETFRSLHGVLSLLPAPSGIYPDTRDKDISGFSDFKHENYNHPCVNFDLYDVDSWQLNLSEEQRLNLKNILDNTKQFHEKMFAYHQRLDQDLCERMLVIAGVGFKTLFRFSYKDAFWGLWDYAEKTTSRVKDNLHREGDGSVPLASAKLEYVHQRFVQAQHGALPNVPAVYNDVFRWLNGERLQLPSNPSAALSEHLSSSDYLSAAPLLDGSISLNTLPEDFDRWQDTPVSPEELNQLRGNLEDGRLPEFLSIRLL